MGRRRLRMLACLTACWVVCAGTVSQASAKDKDMEVELQTLGEKWGRPAVNAQVDRVWHAIPGLSGWRLDVAGSVRETRLRQDGHLHMVWRTVAPRVRLADLPAEPIYRGPREEKSACLMFNVSWGEEYIPAVLQTLTAEGVKATFFLDGAWVEKHPQLSSEIARAGMDIGSHGSGHPDFRKLSTGQLTAQVAGSRERIEQATGVRVDLLAPPAGSYDQRLVKLARQYGCYTVLWTVDTVDWRRPPASAIAGRALAHAEPGMLLLMHPTKPTVEALPQIIAGLREQGYSFKTVDQVVREQPATAPPDLLR